MQTPPLPENSKKTIINLNGEICKPENAKKQLEVSLNVSKLTTKSILVGNSMLNSLEKDLNEYSYNVNPLKIRCPKNTDRCKKTDQSLEKTTSKKPSKKQ